MPDLTRYEVLYPALSLLGAGLILFGFIIVFLRLDQSSNRLIGAGVVGLLFGTIMMGATMQQSSKTLPELPVLTKVRR